MRLTRITAADVKLPLKVPFKTAVREVDHVQSLVVMLDTDAGLRGYGEAPATALITGDTIDSMRAGLGELAPLIKGRSLDDFNAALRIVERGIVHHTSLKAALDMALHDLRAQSLGVPVYKLLGGGTPRLKTDVTISVNDTTTMIADCQRAVAEGFDALKVKVGGRGWREDVEATLAVRAAIGPNIAIRLDANQGWTPKQAVAVLNALEAKGIEIEFVEQPVKASDVAGLKFVTDRTAFPVLADEAVFDSRDAIQLLETHSADILNIKLMKTGGLAQATEIAALARRYGRPCMIGCMLENAISVTAAAHFAVANADVVTLIDLDGPSLCRESVVDGGMRVEGPLITLPDAPGLGIRGVSGLERAVEY
jgi:L-alanine-DL-glutamate epimerase-like enolase superfamily enzyme